MGALHALVCITFILAIAYTGLYLYFDHRTDKRYKEYKKRIDGEKTNLPS
jgi:hypothetical protein